MTIPERLRSENFTLHGVLHFRPDVGVFGAGFLADARHAPGMVEVASRFCEATIRDVQVAGSLLGCNASKVGCVKFSRGSTRAQRTLRRVRFRADPRPADADLVRSVL
jgi:hypothetical protein